MRLELIGVGGRFQPRFFKVQPYRAFVVLDIRELSDGTHSRVLVPKLLPMSFA